MPKYLKIAPDPDAKPCRCVEGNPDCDHFDFCPECGEDYKAHEGHDCLDGFAVAQVGTAKELRDAAKELRDALAACETDRDRLRTELADARQCLSVFTDAPATDTVVVSRGEWEALNAFLEDWRAPESRSLHDWNTSLKAKAARINALRTSAQDHNGEESNNVG